MMDERNSNEYDCKIVFIKEFVKNQDEISAFLKSNKNYRILTNSQNIKNLADETINCKLFEELIPEDNNEKIFEVYEESKKNVELYEQIFEEFEPYGKKIFHVFRYSLIIQFMQIYKIKKILLDKKNTILIFEGFSPIYQILPEIFDKINYTLTDVLLINAKIQKTSFKKLNLETTQFSKVNKIFNPIINNNNIKSKISLLFNLSLKYVTLLIKKYFFSKINSDIDKIISKKFDNEFSNIKNIDCVFFLTASREDAFLKSVYSILDELNQQNRNYMIITSDVVTGINLKNKNIPHLNIFDIIQVIFKILFQNETYEMIKNIVSKKLNEIKPLGYKTMESFLIKEALRAYILLKISEYIFSNIKSNSILVSDDGAILGNAAIQISKTMKIPSYALYTNPTSKLPILSDWFHADKIFVYGNNGKKILSELNYSSDRIDVVGNPRNVMLYNIDKNKIKNQVYEKFNINSSKKIVLLAQSLWHKNDEIWISKLIHYCDKNNLELLIKLHPRYRINSKNHSESKIKKIQKLSKNNVNYTYDYDTSLLILSSTMVITDFSYVGIESILEKKPVILVNFLNDFEHSFMRKILKNSKMTIETKNYVELESTMETCLKNNFPPSDIDLQFEFDEFDYRNDGKATKRIVNYLIKEN